MKYFLMKSDSRYTDMPWVKEIPKEIDVRNIRIEKSKKLPQTLIIPIYESEHTVFIDVVSSPFLLLSETCKKVVEMYEPNITFKQMVLLDSKNDAMQTYHLPILPRIQCLTEKSTFNLDKSVIEYAELDLSKIRAIA